MKRKVTFVEFGGDAVRITYQQEGDVDIVTRAIVIKSELVKPLITGFFQSLIDKILDEEKLSEVTEEEVDRILQNLLKGNK